MRLAHCVARTTVCNHGSTELLSRCAFSAAIGRRVAGAVRRASRVNGVERGTENEECGRDEQRTKLNRKVLAQSVFAQITAQTTV